MASIAPPEDVAAWLRGHPYLEIEDSKTAAAGGVEGAQIDAVVPGVPETECGGDCLGLFAASSGAYMEFKQDIYVMDADGTGRKDLAASRAHDILPAFSPSGDEIVFSRVTFDRGARVSKLFVIGSDGANKTQITDTPRAFEYEADWRPVLLPMP